MHGLCNQGDAAKSALKAALVTCVEGHCARIRSVRMRTCFLLCFLLCPPAQAPQPPPWARLPTAPGGGQELEALQADHVLEYANSVKVFMDGIGYTDVATGVVYKPKEREARWVKMTREEE